MQPARWVHWEPVRGGLEAQELLAARYPQASALLVERSRQVDSVLERLWESFDFPATLTLAAVGVAITAFVYGGVAVIVKMDDLGLHQPWLVFDVLLHGEVPGLPGHTVQHCDPARPMTYCNVTGNRRRWEIMLLPGDDPAELVRPERIWPLVARWLPLATEEQQSAIAHARSVVSGHDAHMGAPDRDLKSNLRRLDYALRKFGLTKRESGTTGHGARHDHLQGQYQDTTGTPAPVRGGGPVDRDLDRQARLRVARVAGHARLRSAGAYIGAIRRSPAGSRDPAQGETGKPGPQSIGDDGDTAAPVA